MIQRNCIKPITEAIIMNRYNESNLSHVETLDFIVDIELLRMEKLIEEREIYEEQFLSMETTFLNGEFDYMISQYEQETKKEEINYFEDDSENLFVYDDYLSQLHDEKLIVEREEYELKYLDDLIDYFALNDFYDCQIKAMEEGELFKRNGFDDDFNYVPDYEYWEYEEKMFWHLHYLKESQFEEQTTCKCGYLDYMPHDDGLCDYLDCYDYPEGPEENLSGIKLY